MKICDVHVSSGGDGLTMIIGGFLNETIQMPNLGTPPPQSVTVNFRGVMYINSTGIGIWMRWLKSEVEAKCPRVLFKFQECPKCIVDQMNLVRGFLPPNVIVQSVFVPFYSEGTDEMKNVLLKLGANFKPSGELTQIFGQERVLDSSGQAMAPDVDMLEYLKFLQLIQRKAG